MQRTTTIQIKAAFLLTVFSLNMITGFACSLGLNMGFNASAHSMEEAIRPPVHLHADGKKHEHQKPAAKPSVHVHTDGKNHEHQQKSVKQDPQQKNALPQKESEGCCKDDVVGFQNLDKNINLKSAINAPALTALISSFLGIDFYTVPATEKELHTARYLFPPPPNILISIQRFQI